MTLANMFEYLSFQRWKQYFPIAGILENRFSILLKFLLPNLTIHKEDNIWKKYLKGDISFHSEDLYTNEQFLMSSWSFLFDTA